MEGSIGRGLDHDVVDGRVDWKGRLEESIGRGLDHDVVDERDVGSGRC